MEQPSKLEENLNALLNKLSNLKRIRDEFFIGKDYRWINKLENSDCEMNEIQKELQELRTGFHKNKFNLRLNLNKKVIEILNELELIEQGGDEDSKSIQMFITEQKKGMPQQFSLELLEQGGDEDSKSIQMFITEQKKGMPQQFSREQLIVFTSNERIGYGGFADVYKGEINGDLVAIKVLRDNARHVTKRQFMAEVSTMFMTSHRNLVKLHGYCYDPKFIALVYEYMENGSLDTILYNNQPSIQWEKLYDIAIQIAKGLSYLHDGCNVSIIHHDVKAANVLLDSNFSPKVTDFGLAKVYKSDKNHATQSQIGGTRVYAAPEVLLGSPVVTYHCDIFSFGMMLFEVLQRKMIGEGEEWFPWQVWENFEKGQLDKFVSGCGIEEKNKEKAHTLSIAALWCIQYKPFDRPSMSTVISVLEGTLQFSPPPNPFTYYVPSIQSDRSSVSTRTGGPPHPLAFSVVSPPCDEWLEEKLPNLESENQVLCHNALAISPTAKASLEQPKATIILGTPESGHTESGEKSVHLDMTPFKSSFRRPEIDKRRKSLNEKQEADPIYILFIRCISQDLGFSEGRPVAACLIYKSLLNWDEFKFDATSIFGIIVETIGSLIEVQNNNDTLCYWLSNLSTLLLLLQRVVESDQQRRTRSASLFGWMSHVAEGLHWKAKSPNLLFKKGLIDLLKEIYRMITSNLENKISRRLESCTSPPEDTFISLFISLGEGSHSQQALIADMQRIVEILNNYLRTLRANYVPRWLVQRVFTQIFSSVNVAIFNNILKQPEYCTFSYGEYVKSGLAELEQWCSSATKEVVGSAWDELRHTRQAIGFLATHEKTNMSLKQIKEQVCPVLSMKQIQRIFLVEEIEKIDDVRILLEVDRRISVDDLLMSMQQIDIGNIEPPPAIRQSGDFFSATKLGVSYYSGFDVILQSADLEY